MKYYQLILSGSLLFVQLLFGQPTYSQATYNVIAFGAVPDTSVNSTAAFQQTIDSCAASGGGQVFVPSGKFKIGSIFLKSNIELYLAHGAKVYGSKNPKDYKPVKPDFISLRTQEETIQLIYAEECTNVAITGTGTIDGQGKSFKKENWHDEGITRPHLLRFIECKNVRIENISLRNAACWMQHFLACTDVHIRGINVFNHANFNNDGIDIDGCKNVVISDVIVDSDDDGIVLKSTSDRACENITISNSIVSSHCNALKLGTESNGGFKNISISNCIVKPSRMDTSNFYGELKGISGISLEMVDGGELTGIMIDNIRIEGTHVPLFIRLGERNRPYYEGQEITQKGDLHDVSISNVSATKVASMIGCSITGLPDKNIQNIRLSNISMEFPGGGGEDQFNRQMQMAKYGKRYPEATMFGDLPAFGCYVHYAEHISFDNIQFRTTSDEMRPAIHLEESKDIVFRNTEIEASPSMECAIRLKNVQNVRVKESVTGGKLPYFATISGEESKELVFLNNSANTSSATLHIGKDVQEEEIRTSVQNVTQKKEIQYPYTFKPNGNPIIQHIRTADPDCHVWEDGKLWMYTSGDHKPKEGEEWYGAMDGYHAFSTEDLITWTDHGEVLHSKDISWGMDGWMWAPGAAYKDGKYYLYYPHREKENGKFKTGVAISDKPEGPFKDIGKYIEGTYGIDPMCFIDDDGQAYLYFHHDVAKLKPNMIELAEKPRKINYGANDKGETNEDMVEAAWMYKKDGLYYFSYSNFKNKEYQSFYGVGKSPYGPFEWKGKLNTMPPGSQDHHSIVQFKGQWYYFYHVGNFTNAQGEEGKSNQRNICVEYLHHNEDGTMKLIKQTTQSIYPK